MKSMRIETDPTVFKWLRQRSGRSVEDVRNRIKTSIDLVETIEKEKRPIVGKEIYPLVYESYELEPEDIAIEERLSNGK